MPNENSGDAVAELGANLEKPTAREAQKRWTWPAQLSAIFLVATWMLRCCNRFLEESVFLWPAYPERQNSAAHGRG